MFVRMQVLSVKGWQKFVTGTRVTDTRADRRTKGLKEKISPLSASY